MNIQFCNAPGGHVQKQQKYWRNMQCPDTPVWVKHFIVALHFFFQKEGSYREVTDKQQLQNTTTNLVSGRIAERQHNLQNLRVQDQVRVPSSNTPTYLMLNSSRARPCARWFNPWRGTRFFASFLLPLSSALHKRCRTFKSNTFR